MSQYFGYLSGILITLSFVPYLISIFKGDTKPERASWLVWSILGSIAFFSQLAKGASHSLWLPGVQTIGDILILALSIKYGMGGLFKRDIVALCITGIGLVLWYLTNNPLIALVLAIIIDASGAALTIIKSYKHPYTEAISAWILTGLGGFFALFAVGDLNWTLFLFPLYTFIANVLIVSSITLGKRKLALSSSD